MEYLSLRSDSLQLGQIFIRSASRFILGRSHVIHYLCSCKDNDRNCIDWRNHLHFGWTLGLDVGRFHWSLVPWSVQVAGVFGYAAALCVNLWAMRVNRFYSSVVRVQSDRGHCVIDVGPYRFVRHPGYLATLTAMLCGGIALGSWLAMIPVLGFAAIFIRRTMLEDQMLRDELPNYLEYTRRVRWRLIPGVF